MTDRSRQDFSVLELGPVCLVLGAISKGFEMREVPKASHRVLQGTAA